MSKTSSQSQQTKTEPIEPVFAVEEVPTELGVFYRREQHGYIPIEVRLPTGMVNEFRVDKNHPDLLENARSKGEMRFDSIISGHGEWIVKEEMGICPSCRRAMK